MIKIFRFLKKGVCLCAVSFVIFISVSSSFSDSVDLDSTNPTYNRAVNPLVAPSERIKAMESLIKQKDFDELEGMLATLLNDPDQPVLVKNFIVQYSKEKAGDDSPIALKHLLINKAMDVEVRRLALSELWRAELIEVLEIEHIIRDPHEDMVLRDYAMSLLRDKVSYFDRESRRIMEEYAMDPSAEEPLQIQAIGSLSQDLENPQTLGLFQRMAQDKSMAEKSRMVLLLNIKAQDEMMSEQMNRQILLDPREPVDLRIFTLEILLDDTFLAHSAEMKQLAETTDEPTLKSKINERFKSLEE